MFLTTLLDSDVKETQPEPDFQLLSAALPCSVDRMHPDLCLVDSDRSSEMVCDAQFPGPSITPVF